MLFLYEFASKTEWNVQKSRQWQRQIMWPKKENCTKRFHKIADAAQSTITFFFCGLFKWICVLIKCKYCVCIEVLSTETSRNLAISIGWLLPYHIQQTHKKMLSFSPGRWDLCTRRKKNLSISVQCIMSHWSPKLISFLFLRLQKDKKHITYSELRCC